MAGRLGTLGAMRVSKSAANQRGKGLITALDMIFLLLQNPVAQLDLRFHNLIHLDVLFECKSSEERVVYKKLNSTGR